MKISTIEITGRHVTLLEPDEGYNYVTNGSIWGVKTCLGRLDSIDNWHDTNDEPPEPEEAAADEQADYA